MPQMLGREYDEQPVYMKGHCILCMI